MIQRWIEADFSLWCKVVARPCLHCRGLANASADDFNFAFDACTRYASLQLLYFMLCLCMCAALILPRTHSIYICTFYHCFCSAKMCAKCINKVVKQNCIPKKIDNNKRFIFLDLEDVNHNFSRVGERMHATDPCLNDAVCIKCVYSVDWLFKCVEMRGA